MILSADDFGISPAVSEGILELVSAQRISATSCMMNGLAETDALKSLVKFSNQIDIGLHLVLTDDRPLAEISHSSGLVDLEGRFHSFKLLTKNAYLRKLNRESVYLEIKSQIDRFVEVTGKPPDFVDGHQHCHQLPVIREELIRVLKSYPAIRYVRVACSPNSWILREVIQLGPKPALVNWLMSQPGNKTAKGLDQANIMHNRYLVGWYDYFSGASFKEIFDSYLSLKPETNDIFFCHPGYVDDILRSRDSLIEGRLDNLHFLKSDEFVSICETNAVKINRFSP
jgi:predicted glycoside hydrolase/deacetylase ChbG (UPF0249 family)